MKKEELNYYSEFITMTQYAVNISKILEEYIPSYSYENSKQIKQKVHEQEHLADNTQHNILNYLIKDFVPPIDRDDIINVSRKLDDIIDNIDEVVIDLDILAVEKLKNDFNSYVELFSRATSKLNELFIKFNEMKNYDEVKKLVVELNGIEEEGDNLFQNSIRILYANEENAKDVIKWTAIYNRLEDCFDSIEHVAECVDEIYMKNS